MAAAEKWIKESTGAQEVRRVQITTTAQSLRTSPVYVPVYIFRSLHFGAAHSFFFTKLLHPYPYLRV